MLTLTTYCTSIDITPSLRVDLFGARMFRIRQSSLQGEAFPEKYQISFVIGHLQDWAPVEYSLEKIDSKTIITTDALVISVMEDGSFTVADKAGKGIYPSEGPIYGMFRDGYTLFDSASPFEEENENSRYAHYFYNPKTGSYADTFIEQDEILDRFFIYGPDYPSLFKQFRQLTGASPIPPLKAFGCMQTQHLSCKGDQTTLMNVAKTYRDKKIPCDTLIFDFEWGDGCNGSEQINWGDSVDWSSSYSSPLSPEEMIKELKAMNFDVLLIYHSIPEFSTRWNQGWTGATHEAGAWWKAIDEKIALGIAGNWMDTRRNDITNDEIQKGLRERMPDDQRAVMVTNYDTQDIICWNRKFYKIPQANAMGTHRYGTHWTGDCDFTWQELRWQIEAITGVQGALKGICYLNSDTIGRNWKILVRWRQFTALSAIARSHSTKPWDGEENSNKEWLDGFEDSFAWEEKEEAQTEEEEKATAITQKESPLDWTGNPEPAVKKIQEFRYKLLPFLYSLAHDNWTDGLPMTRPLLMSYPEDTNCNANQWSCEYMLGDAFLVAPVVRDVDTQDVYLPEAHEWYDFYAGTYVSGGLHKAYDTSDIEKLPLFVRDDAIVPMWESTEWIDNNAHDKALELHIFAKKDASFTLTEDDKQTHSYESGKVAVSEITYDAAAKTLSIAPVKGSFKGMPEKRKLIVYSYETNAETKTIEYSLAEGVKVEL